ncbi:MAG: C40 family peptidase [Flammeovirgaceae bacterium]|nr:C40 family peptidase [Flammeovirgaceae bacterium]
MDVVGYGVGRLAIIPVRKEPVNTSEQITQLLFGDHYEILEVSKNEKWMFIRIHLDQTEGWIDATQHHEITVEYFELINHANFKITTDITSNILYRKSPLTILLGSIVPISGSELFKMEEQLAFNGESKSLGQKRDLEFIKEVALKYINSPFLPGGKSPFGIDSSGFVQMVFRVAGYSLPRDLRSLATAGKTVEDFNQHRLGDIALFKNTIGNIHHAGICLNDHKIIHVYGHVRVDQLSTYGIASSDTGKVTHGIDHIQRIIS